MIRIFLQFFFVVASSKVHRLGESESFKRYDSQLHRHPFLGCEKYVFGSDDYWKCCITGYTSSLQHQVGTCKMGPSTDPNAVVNPQLQVYGIKHLRVVDASISMYFLF